MATVRTIEIHSAEYPAPLREIPGAPRTLWVRGAFPHKETKYLAIVGSRALSSYGREACEKLVAGLSGYPISIISGLALGADACAHKASLAAGLHTIAVPGSGLDDAVLYPRTNLSLARDILSSGGLLLSEHEPQYNAQSYDFPSRNRIMVGMADAVLMIEAGPKSGTLITARLTSEYNRDLLCVPHRMGDPHGYGAHLFLRIGATLVSEPAHILEALGFETREESTERSFVFSENEQKMINLLSEPLPKDELLRLSNLPAGSALATIVALELKGAIKEEFGLFRRI